VVKRVAFVVPGSLETPTGGYAYDRRIINELEHLGWHVGLADVGGEFPWPSEATLRTARARLMNLPAGWPVVIDGLALGAMANIASELARRNPVLALVHHPLALEWGLSDEQASVLRRSERNALASVHAVIVTSPATARIVASDYGVPADRITVVRPGNDAVPRARGRRYGVVHLLSVGAVVPRKGFGLLVESLAMLADLPWKVTIAGDLTRHPTTAAALHADISHHSLGERIVTLGAVSSEQLAALYDSADLFVLASYFEGYGMAYAEALAHGLPVIGTKAGAIPETVPERAGLLVPPGDPAALAEALRRAITDSGLRESLSAAALEAASQLPTWSQSAAIFAGALQRLQRLSQP
jgi:glycosyltransferase involved in cell wall biosynthesis